MSSAFLKKRLYRCTALGALAYSMSLMAIMALVTEARAHEIKIEHSQGTLTLPAQPKKVLVFDLASLDTLNALGVEVQGVPTAKFPPRLAKYADDKFVKIGSVFEPDFEKVNAEAPDLIIAGGRSRAKFEDLKKIAPTIDLSVDTKAFMVSAKRNIETLGKIFGKEAEARAQIAALEASMASVREVAGKSGKALLLLTTGGKMSAYGPGSRFGMLHTSYGVEAARTDLKSKSATHGQPISFEFILETNPDWIYVIDRDTAIGREDTSARKLLDNELVSKTTAWKKGQVVYLDAANWYLISGGLGALQENAAQISKALHGK